MANSLGVLARATTTRGCWAATSVGARAAARRVRGRRATNQTSHAGSEARARSPRPRRPADPPRGVAPPIVSRRASSPKPPRGAVPHPRALPSTMAWLFGAEDDGIAALGLSRNLPWSPRGSVPGPRARRGGARPLRHPQLFPLQVSLEPLWKTRWAETSSPTARPSSDSTETASSPRSERQSWRRRPPRRCGTSSSTLSVRGGGRPRRCFRSDPASRTEPASDDHSPSARAT